MPTKQTNEVADKCDNPTDNKNKNDTCTSKARFFLVLLLTGLVTTLLIFHQQQQGTNNGNNNEHTNKIPLAPPGTHMSGPHGAASPFVGTKEFNGTYSSNEENNSVNAIFFHIQNGSVCISKSGDILMLNTTSRMLVWCTNETAYCGTDESFTFRSAEGSSDEDENCTVLVSAALHSVRVNNTELYGNNTITDNFGDATTPTSTSSPAATTVEQQQQIAEENGKLRRFANTDLGRSIMNTSLAIVERGVFGEGNPFAQSLHQLAYMMSSVFGDAVQPPGPERMAEVEVNMTVNAMAAAVEFLGVPESEVLSATVPEFNGNSSTSVATLRRTANELSARDPRLICGNPCLGMCGPCCHCWKFVCPVLKRKWWFWWVLDNQRSCQCNLGCFVHDLTTSCTPRKLGGNLIYGSFTALFVWVLLPWPGVFCSSCPTGIFCALNPRACRTPISDDCQK